MEQRENIESLLKDINKEFGKESIMQLDNSSKLNIKHTSSGSMILDKTIGIGGYPKGRITEIYGPEGSGKTTLALHAIAEVQKQGGTVAFIDAEHALSIEYAKRIGVNTEEMLLSQPDSGEQAMMIADALISSGKIDIVIIDSVAALTPQVEINGEIGDHTIGAQARLMSKALRKLAGPINQSGCTVIFINQIREKVGVIFGNPEVTPGGRALKFYASLRLEIRAGEKLKDGNNFIGQMMKVKVVKNKISDPFKNCILELTYNYGINKMNELITFAVEKDIIEKAGSWYSYKNQKIGQGKTQTAQFLKDNTKIKEEIEKLVFKKNN